MLDLLSRVVVIAMGRVLGDVILCVLAHTEVGMKSMIKWSTRYSKKVMEQSDLFD